MIFRMLLGFDLVRNHTLSHSSLIGHWNLGKNSSNSFESVLDSLFGVTVGSNTDNAAYDLTIHSQLKWAKCLPTYQNTYYLSIVGRITSNTSEIQSTDPLAKRLIRAIQNEVIKLFFYIISAKDMKICGQDCSTWFLHGWDGLVSCFSQRKPFLPSPHHHPVSENPHQNFEIIHPGQWYSWELPNDHIRFALSCPESWSIISEAVQKMDCHRTQTQALPEKFDKSKTPDMQEVSVHLFDRQTSAYPIHQIEVLLALIFLGLGHFACHPTFQFSQTSFSAITCCLGVCLLRSKSFHSDEFQERRTHLFKLAPVLPLLPSEAVMLTFNVMRFVILLHLWEASFCWIAFSLSSMQAVEVICLILSCDTLHDHESLLHLSLRSVLINLHQCTPNTSPSLYIFSLCLKEIMHILSRLGWVLNDSHVSKSCWQCYWGSFLFITLIHLMISISTTNFVNLVSLFFIWEVIVAIRELSYSYQIYLLSRKQHLRDQLCK
jgi:hypothetical protein